MSEITNQDQASNAIKSFSVDISKENYLECIIEKDEKLLDRFKIKKKFIFWRKNKEEDRLKFNIKYKDEGDKSYYISQHFKQLPYGLMDKSITGLGATTLEMRAKRHSIIVTPTKNLAYNKYSKDKEKYFYVGSSIGDIKTNIGPSEVEEYLKDKTIIYKKLFVVADSLVKVIGALERLQINYKDDYFILIDEIDKFVKDSDYREKLEIAFDYYKTFNKKNRAMITATISDFSSPTMLKEEKTIFSFEQPKRDMQIIATSDATTRLEYTIINILKENPNDKIFIAINSVEKPLAIIKNLIESSELILGKSILEEKDFGIACSNSRADDSNIKPFYIDLNDINNNEELPRQICFTTSTNFVGIDLNDDYHLITVSPINRQHHVLSVLEIIQVYGRNRRIGGTLSDTFIYETKELKGEKDVAKKQLTEEDKTDKLKKLKKFHIQYAQKMVNFVESYRKIRKIYYHERNHMDLLERKLTETEINKRVDSDLDKFIKTLNRDMYARKLENKEIDVSYFLIDSIVEKDYYHSFVYNTTENVISAIKNSKLNLDNYEFQEYLIETPYKSPQITIEEDIEQCLIYLDKIIEQEKAESNFHKTQNLKIIFEEIEEKAKTNTHIKDLLDKIKELSYFAGNIEAAKILKEKVYISFTTKPKPNDYNKVYNNLVFMSLVLNETFKEKIISLEVGETYIREIIINTIHQALLSMRLEIRNKSSQDKLEMQLIGELIGMKAKMRGKEGERYEIITHNLYDTNIETRKTIHSIREDYKSGWLDPINVTSRITSPESQDNWNIWKGYTFDTPIQ